MKNAISIITPVYNESENIEELCRILDEHAIGKPYIMELVFVDDGSKDDTLEKLREYPFQYAGAKIVSLSCNFGSYAAIRAGMTVATSMFTMLFSGDLQEPVELIDMLYNKMQDGYEIVFVEKGQTKISKSEKMFSGFYASMIRRFAVSDFPNGGVNNFMITARIREKFAANPELNSSVFLQLMTMGFKKDFIVCDYLKRARGESKWTFSKKVKTFVDSFVAFSFAPLRAVTFLGIFLSLLGGIYALFIIIVKLTGILVFEAGFPSVVCVLLIGFGLTNISLGIIAEYLWRTLDVSRNRDVFLIDTIEEIVPKKEYRKDFSWKD